LIAALYSFVYSYFEFKRQELKRKAAITSKHK
jgi:hypothetical protein